MAHTHLRVSLFVQLGQQPHHNTDSTWIYNDTVPHFPPAGKKKKNIKDLTLPLTAAKRVCPIFQQSTALKLQGSAFLAVATPGTTGSAGSENYLWVQL